MKATVEGVVRIEGRSSAKLAPATQMRQMLVVSKRQGVSFERAWRSAHAHVRWPHDTVHRQQWKDQLDGTREHWRRAYENEGKPNGPLAAVAVLLSMVEPDEPPLAA